MVEVAERGTASCCIALDGGDPGCRQDRHRRSSAGPASPDRSHAWIVAFAPAEDPQYAVVRGAHQGPVHGRDRLPATGGRLAGPIAKSMLDAAFDIEPDGVDVDVAPTTEPSE